MNTQPCISIADTSMPVHRYILPEFSLHYVAPRHPFAPGDLADQAKRDLADPPVPNIFELPLILDLRSIDLLAFSTESFKLLLSKRQALDISVPTPPCAYVVRDEGSYGMLRVFTSFADARGYRSERLTLITEDLVEAVDWIYPQLFEPQDSHLALLIGLEALVDQIDAIPQVAYAR